MALQSQQLAHAPARSAAAPLPPQPPAMYASHPPTLPPPQPQPPSAPLPPHAMPMLPPPPAPKRARLEPQLMPEAEFAAKHMVSDSEGLGFQITPSFLFMIIFGRLIC